MASAEPYFAMDVENEKIMSEKSENAYEVTVEDALQM